jgi:hypothetical protein
MTDMCRHRLGARGPGSNPLDVLQVVFYIWGRPFAETDKWGTSSGER